MTLTTESMRGWLSNANVQAWLYALEEGEIPKPYRHTPDAYRVLFGRTPPGAAIQFVALRLALTAPVPGAEALLRLPAHPAGDARKGTRSVYFPDAGGSVETPVFDRYALAPGFSTAGPAVFEENESTFIVGPGSRITMLADGALLAETVA